MKIKKGDQILVIAGKSKGFKGKVLDVFPIVNKITVEGANIGKKHVRPKREGEKGQIIEMPRPFDASNAKIICPKCKKAVRIGYEIIKSEDKKGKTIKVRLCKKCNQEI